MDRRKRKEGQRSINLAAYIWKVDLSVVMCGGLIHCLWYTDVDNTWRSDSESTWFGTLWCRWRRLAEHQQSVPGVDHLQHSAGGFNTMFKPSVAVIGYNFGLWNLDLRGLFSILRSSVVKSNYRGPSIAGHFCQNVLAFPVYLRFWYSIFSKCLTRFHFDLVVILSVTVKTLCRILQCSCDSKKYSGIVLPCKTVVRLTVFLLFNERYWH